MEKDKRTELKSLGEFGLIDRLTSDLKLINKSTVAGAGDDAAIIAVNEFESHLVTTDLLLEGIHFDLSYYPLKHLGYKAVSVNISDIAAMNAIPEQIVVSIGLSNRFSVEAVEELYEGIKQACSDYKVDLVGGDTSASKSGLILSITAIGKARKELIAKRSGAQKSDIICVTGDLGGAFLGLQILEREKQEFLSNPDMQPQLETKEYIVGKQLKPVARMDFIHEMRSLNLIPSSMIDVSDGLASELFHISKASNVGTVIYEEKLPIDVMTYETAREFSIDATTAVLNGGEDYELLFTINQKDFDKIKNHPDITVIGYITDISEGNFIVTKGGRKVPLQAQGWTHF